MDSAGAVVEVAVEVAAEDEDVEEEVVMAAEADMVVEEVIRWRLLEITSTPSIGAQ